MINPVNRDLVIYQSATFDKTITWRDAGEVVDMRGYQVALQIRDISSNKLIFTATTLNGMIEWVDSRKGKFKFNIPAEITETFDFELAAYDLLVKFGDRVCRLSQGEVLLSISRTKLEALNDGD